MRDFIYLLALLVNFIIIVISVFSGGWLLSIFFLFIQVLIVRNYLKSKSISCPAVPEINSIVQHDHVHEKQTALSSEVQPVGAGVNDELPSRLQVKRFERVPVVGVSFCNEDGSSRQEAIALLKSGNHVLISLNPSELLSNRVSVYSSLRCIGSLSAEVVQMLSTFNFKESLGIVRDIGIGHNGIYSLTIDFDTSNTSDLFYYFKSLVQGRLFKGERISLNFMKIRAYSDYRNLNGSKCIHDILNEMIVGQDVLVRCERSGDVQDRTAVICHAKEVGLLPKSLSKFFSYLYFDSAVGSVFDICELESGKVDFRINFKVNIKVTENNQIFSEFFDCERYFSFPVILFFIIFDTFGYDKGEFANFIFMHKTLGAVKFNFYPESCDDNSETMINIQGKPSRYVEGVVLKDGRACKFSFDFSFFEEFFTYVGVNEYDYEFFRKRIRSINITPFILNYFDMRGDGSEHTSKSKGMLNFKKVFSHQLEACEVFDLSQMPYDLGYEYYDSKNSWYASMEPEYEINEQFNS